MPHINSNESERSLVPNPYSVFSQLASSPYASLHPLALKRLFEEEYYFKSLFTAAFAEKFKGEHISNDVFQHTNKLQTVDLQRQSSLINSINSTSLVSCSSSPLSPSPTSPHSGIFLPPHIDTNNNTIPTSKLPDFKFIFKYFSCTFILCTTY